LRDRGRGWILRTVTNELARLLDEIGSGRPIDLAELEQAYTTGCAEILELEAESMRVRRRLNELHEQLRHVRTAIEWLQEERGGRRASQ
jgi:septation ring formation regulator EzrA